MLFTLNILFGVFPVLANYESQKVWLVTEFTDMPIYEGMPIEYVVKLMIDPLVEVQSYCSADELKVEGCEIEYSPNVPESMQFEQLPNNADVISIVLDRLYVYPHAPGVYFIPGIKYDVEMIEQVIVNTPYWGRKVEYRPRKNTLISETKIFEVRSIESNVPDGYGGAIGDFIVNLIYKNQPVKLGEFFTFSISISGVGNISEVELPILSCANCSLECQMNEPICICREQKAGTQMMGVVRYEYLVKPMEEGTLSISVPRFVFFDPLSGVFKSIGEKRN